MTDLREYRPCVGIVIFNDQGLVWLGKRFAHDGPYCWQFPQGGIDPDEDPEDAALREAWEETGVDHQFLTPLASTKDWLIYQYPDGYQRQKSGKSWRGQKQKWFAYRYHGKMTDFDLKAHPPQEFSEWRWGELHKTPMLIIPFKRKVYEKIVIEFEEFSDAVISGIREHDA